MRDLRRRPVDSASFLLGLMYSGTVIPLWLSVFAGDLVLMSFAPRDWHVDEMLLGYVATILGGFSAYGGSELDRAASAAGHVGRARLHLARWTEHGRLNVVDRMTGRPAIDAAISRFPTRSGKLSNVWNGARLQGFLCGKNAETKEGEQCRATSIVGLSGQKAKVLSYLTAAARQLVLSTSLVIFSCK